MSEAEPMTDETTVDERPVPWPLAGYAPGSYMRKCYRCGAGHIADKRAMHCLPCAVELASAALAVRPPSDDLRAAMKGLRPYTSGPWHLKVVGDVLAAWDRQQGDGM